MILGAKGGKSDGSMLARGFLTYGSAKNIKSSRNRADFEYFEDCENAKQGTIRYQR